MAAHQAPPSLGSSRQEYWSELLIPSPGDLPDPGIKPRSPTLPGRFFAIWVTRETSYPLYLYSNHWWNRTNPGVAAAAAAAKSLQLCPTLCDPIDGSPPGSAVPGILQARTLEWVAISFSNAWKWKGKVKSLSYVRLFVTPWTVAHQAPPSMGFSGQEYWSGLPLCVA